MAGDEKTSEYTPIVGADIAVGDMIEVIDISEDLDADKNKSVTAAELFLYKWLTGLTAKTVPVAGDEFNLADSAVAGIPKKCTMAQLEAVLDHDNFVNAHDLTSDIDHDAITNGHNLTSHIDHDAILNNHNLTTDINHDAITNFVADEHIDWTDPAHSGNPFTLGASSELTIATGVITVTGSLHTVDTESDGATDDLDTINGGVAGQILVLMAENGARDVVVKDGTGNLALAGDFTMDTTDDTITLMWVGAQWVELFRSNNA